MTASSPSRRDPRDEPHGILVVDKPRGPTSHDVVARVRKRLKTRHVGHAGTLDPMATGVLVIAVGDGTKLVPWLTADDKSYETTVRLGIETDTLDMEGKEVARELVPDAVLRWIRDPSRECSLLAAALASEVGRDLQVPPAYSAIRIGGERAHELARAGRLEGELPARPVRVRALTLVGGRVDESGERVELDLRIEATKGYFVRSFARDLARGLGTLGHLTALRRVRSGGFTIDEARDLESVTSEGLLTVTEAASRALPITVLDEAGVRAAMFGQRVAPAQMRDPHPGPSAWLDASSRLVAIGTCDADGSGRVLRGFPAAP